LDEENLKNNNISFGDFIDNLSPYDFTILGTFIGFLFSFGLNPGQQNSLGNWFELIGQVLLTISAKSSATISNQEYENLLSNTYAIFPVNKRYPLVRTKNNPIVKKTAPTTLFVDNI
jgi:hypothetical protein